MWTYDQLIQFAAQIVGNFQAHQWLIGVAVLFGGLTAIWRGDVNLPAPIGPWIREEQAKRFSASFQYITIALVCVTAIVSTMASGIPLKQAVLAAITAALTGLFGHDAVVSVGRELRKGPGVGVIAIMLASMTSLSGCQWLQSACGSATPAIEAAQVYTADAQAVITGTRITVASIVGIPADKLAQINKYLDDAETIIGSMRATESAAISACAQPNMAGLIASLVALWTELEPIVAPLLLTKQPLRTPQYVLTARVRPAHK